MVLYTLLKSTIIILMWVGLWGLTEIAVDHVSNDKQTYRILSYFIIIVFGAICLSILDSNAII